MPAGKSRSERRSSLENAEYPETLPRESVRLAHRLGAFPLTAGNDVALSAGELDEQRYLARPQGRVVVAAQEGAVVARDDQGRAVIAVTLQLEVDLVMAPALGDLGEITLRRSARATVLGSDLP